jgi:hypothetical protein
MGEPNNRKLIPDKALISILTDVYLADGLLSTPEIREMFSSRDSVMNYIDIIERHGYSKERMDKTIKYYIINKPKRLIKIYDQVLGQLSEMESRLANDPEITEVSETNLFKLTPSYSLPDPDCSERPGFDLVLTPPGYYNLTFTVTVYQDDESVNPCFTAFLCNSDTAKSIKPDYLPPIKYQKNGLPCTYTVFGKIEKNGSQVFKGWFYDYENRPDLRGQHAKIENISFSFRNEIL